MACQIFKINPQKPDKKIIQKAAQIIKKGGLVAFPTETVYGLGANALNKKAVQKIFKSKKRPADNPLIIHIADIKDLFRLAQKVPPEVKILVKKFWPGPLTLVLWKKKIVPKEVTAGAPTLAIRMPKNKIALELIKSAHVPLAAPSANLAGRPSPTSAQDVFEDLGDKIDLILDGGKTKIGLESTVVDLTVKPPQVLRPGGLTLEKLRKVLKDIQFNAFLPNKKVKNDKKFIGQSRQAEKIVKSPGMKYRHYAPQAPLILIEDKNQKLKIKNLIDYYQKQKKIVGVMATEENQKFYKKADVIISVGPRRNLEKIARNLFNALREFDRRGVDIILAETFSEKGIGFAIMNRLRKAAQAPN